MDPRLRNPLVENTFSYRIVWSMYIWLQNYVKKYFSFFDPRADLERFFGRESFSKIFRPILKFRNTLICSISAVFSKPIVIFYGRYILLGYNGEISPSSALWIRKDQKRLRYDLKRLFGWESFSKFSGLGILKFKNTLLCSISAVFSTPAAIFYGKYLLLRLGRGGNIPLFLPLNPPLLRSDITSVSISRPVYKVWETKTVPYYHRGSVGLRHG